MLNSKKKPCMDSPNYKYQNCIIGKILDLIGCQPYWVNISQSHENCTKIKQLQTFLETYKFMSYATANKINDYFGCLKPCTFIEYQVFESNRLIINSYSYIYLCWNFPDCRTTNLFRKTIADYGGLLGLFVGANFLEYFEFCIALFHKLYATKMFSSR